MLLELRIVNLATILDQTIEFGPGFNIITGETGAGKSVIIAGLGFVLGDRLKPDMLRTGADRAMVEARFYTPEGVARSEGGEPPEEELIIRRELLDNGRSKAFVNDRGVTVTALHDLRVQLVEIHGQHDHQALLDERRHIDFVDAYGDLMPQRAAVKKLHVERRILRERRRRFEQTRRERRERILLLRFLSDEIDRTAPRPGEIEELEDELNRLQ
ncbi:AAA family ATPase, partial [bacterium]|nr:AAA family ATPase [candidate division CSSED10-310 bacterium]